MGNFGKEALTPDTQLTFTCFLKKRFFLRLALTLGTGGSTIHHLHMGKITHKLNMLNVGDNVEN